MGQSTFILKPVDPDSGERIDQIAHVVEVLEGLPYEKAWRIEIEQHNKSERSLKQNAYLFGVAYKLLSEGTGYEKDDLHVSLLARHFGSKLKRVPKSKLYNPQGLLEVPIRTTTTDENGNRAVLGITAFSEYVDYVKRFAAGLDIFIPDPDPNYAIYRERSERTQEAA